MQLLAQMQSLLVFGNRKSYSVPLLWAIVLESPTIELQGTQFYVGRRVLGNSPRHLCQDCYLGSYMKLCSLE